MTDTLGIVFHSLTLAALAAVLWCSIRNGRSIARLARQQAEVELDGAIDRELLTGKRDTTTGVVRDRARSLLSSPSEAILHRAYGDAYEQELGKRVETRRR